MSNNIHATTYLTDLLDRLGAHTTAEGQVVLNEVAAGVKNLERQVDALQSEVMYYHRTIGSRLSD